jgi:hypothetical protein
MATNRKLQPDLLKVTWKQYLNEVDLVYSKLKNNKYDEIIALSRGGLFLGLILSHKLNINLDTINPKEVTKEYFKKFKNKKVLLVDDLVDSGKTYTKIFNYIYLNTAKVEGAVIYIKPWSIVIPKYFNKKTEKWVIHPWEGENVN